MATRLSPAVVADSVLRFLDLVAELHEVAVAIHNDNQDPNCDISRLSDSLASAIE